MRKKQYTLLIIILLMAFNIASRVFDYKKIDTIIIEDNTSYPIFNNQEINDKVSSFLTNIDTYSATVIDNNIISILATGENGDQTILYDDERKKDINLSDIVNNYDKFTEIIYENLCSKYPLFIADYIKSNNYNDLNYLLKENELIIYFDVSNITPYLYEVVYLVINYIDI